MQLKRVVITGMGALMPIGNTLADYWSALLQGKSGAAPITRFDASNFKTRFACELKNYAPLQYFDRREVRKLDPFSQYAIIASAEAIEDAGLITAQPDLDRIGVIWGSGIGGISIFEEEMQYFFETGGNKPRFNPFFVPKMILDIAAGHISIKYGFRGLNYAVASACASSTHAIIDAFNYIRLGKADAIVTGGSEAGVTRAGIGGFNALRALSTRNDSPETASRPFDRERDGFVLAEGAAALILEEYERAKQRGARIYAEVAGGGMSADAHHLTAPHPEGNGAFKVMQNALDDAGLQPSDVDYVNVHGTSTPLGDVSEVKALLRLFGEHAYKLNISSTKSMTGHLLGAAGAAEAIACIMAIHNDAVPPTINHFTDDEAFDPKLNFTFNAMQKRKVRVALSNTFGFGGHNASFIVKKMV